jgi:hypothetical protein
MNHKPNPNVNFVAHIADRQRLEAVGQQLSLTRSEVARRPLRLGLDKLEQLELPGCPKPGRNPRQLELPGCPKKEPTPRMRRKNKHKLTIGSKSQDADLPTKESQVQKFNCPTCDNLTDAIGTPQRTLAIINCDCDYNEF